MGRVGLTLLVTALLWAGMATVSVASAEQEKGEGTEKRVEKVAGPERIEQMLRKAKELEESGRGDAAAELKREVARLQAQGAEPKGDQEVGARLKRRIRMLEEMAAAAQKEGMPDLAAQLRERAEQTERELREILKRSEGGGAGVDRPLEKAERTEPSAEKSAAALRELSQRQENLRNQVAELSREVERLREAVARLERRLNEAAR